MPRLLFFFTSLLKARPNERTPRLELLAVHWKKRESERKREREREREREKETMTRVARKGTEREEEATTLRAMSGPALLF